jgi:hypothetical protein
MNALLEYLRDRKPNPFQPHPYYSQFGDFIIVYFENVPCFVETITDAVEVYRADDNRRIVGVKIHRASELVVQPPDADWSHT